MAPASLNLVVIRAADIDRSAHFYRRLGLEFTKHSHGTGPEHYASEGGAIVFEIYPRQGKPGTPEGLRLGFLVASVDPILAALTEAGAKIVSPAKDSPWGRRAVVDDPDGYRVELTEPAPASRREPSWPFAKIAIRR